MSKAAIVALVLSLFASPAMALAAPAPAASSTTAIPESAAFTATAHSFYDSVLHGSIDRSHASEDLNKVLSDSTLQSFSHQLGELGQPQWEFVKLFQSTDGRVGIYKLAYPKVTLYLTFGMTEKGTVTTFFIGKQPI